METFSMSYQSLCYLGSTQIAASDFRGVCSLGREPTSLSRLLSEQLLLTGRGKCCSAVQEEEEEEEGGKESSLFCLTLSDHRKSVQTPLLGMTKSS